MNGLFKIFFYCHHLCKKNLIVPNLVSKTVDDLVGLPSTDVRLRGIKSSDICISFNYSFKRSFHLVFVSVLSFMICSIGWNFETLIVIVELVFYEKHGDDINRLIDIEQLKPSNKVNIYSPTS